MAAGDKQQGGRRFIGTFVRLLITVAVFAALLLVVDPREVWAAVTNLPPLAFVEVVAWFLLAMALGALRWGLLMWAFGAAARPPMLRLLRLYYVGLFYNSFLPGGMGGDVVRGVATREAFGDSGATAGLSVVLVERVMGLAGLLVLTAGVTLLQPIEGVPEPRVLGGAGLLAVLVALFGLLFARRLAPHLPPALGRLAAAVPVPARFAPLAIVLLIAVMGHIVLAVAGHVLVSALAPQVALHQSLVLIPIAMASAFVPITTSGAGVREAAFVALYALIGVPRGVALAASLGMWACQLVMAAAGGVVALFTPLSLTYGDTLAAGDNAS